MAEEQIISINAGFPWFKVFAIGTGIVGSVGGIVYLWTSKRIADNHQLALAKKEMSILDTQKKLMDKEKAEQEKCKEIEIILPAGKWGCFKEDQK